MEQQLCTLVIPSTPVLLWSSRLNKSRNTTSSNKPSLLLVAAAALAPPSSPLAGDDALFELIVQHRVYLQACLPPAPAILETDMVSSRCQSEQSRVKNPPQSHYHPGNCCVPHMPHTRTPTPAHTHTFEDSIILMAFVGEVGGLVATSRNCDDDELSWELGGFGAAGQGGTKGDDSEVLFTPLQTASVEVSTRSPLPCLLAHNPRDSCNSHASTVTNNVYTVDKCRHKSACWRQGPVSRCPCGCIRGSGSLLLECRMYGQRWRPRHC